MPVPQLKKCVVSVLKLYLGLIFIQTKSGPTCQLYLPSLTSLMAMVSSLASCCSARAAAVVVLACANSSLYGRPGLGLLMFYEHHG